MLGNAPSIKVDGNDFRAGLESYFSAAISSRNRVIIGIKTDSAEPVHTTGGMGNEKTMTCSKKCLDIPVWRRYTLTIEEAAGYYHIGEGKLRMLIDEHPNEDFYVMNGNRALIKREKFERYLDQATAV